MNPTESFLIQMGITYLGITLNTNKSLSLEQKAAIENAIVASQGVIQIFTK